MISGVKALGLETCATPGHADRRPGQGAEGGRARLLQPQPRHRPATTTTRWSPPAPTRTAWIRWRPCATRAWRPAAAASSAWARRARDRAGLAAPAGHPAQPSRQPADQRPDADPGHAAGQVGPVDGLEFVRMIAVARLVCPQDDGPHRRRPRAHEPRAAERCASWPAPIRSSSAPGLLTTNNPGRDTDAALLADLKMRPMGSKRRVAPQALSFTAKPPSASRISRRTLASLATWRLSSGAALLTSPDTGGPQ